jgi:hypothetical protein
MDFVNSLQLKIEDFEATGRLGYVEGISRIIVNSMKDMDIEKRPMHCTDLKRETLYIKDQNVWTKENPDKNKLKRAVKQVAKLNLNQSNMRLVYKKVFLLLSFYDLKSFLFF